MIILDITYKNNSSAQITLEGDLCFVIDALKLYELKLEKGGCVDEDMLEKLTELSNTYAALNKAAACLSRADFSSKGLKRRLTQKGIDKDAAKSAVEFFEQRGYVNDEAFARKICGVYTAEKHFGARRAIDEMLKRGVDYETARLTAQEMADDSTNIALLFEKKYAGLDLSDQKTKNRVVNSLVRAGYGFEDINSLLRNIE